MTTNVRHGCGYGRIVAKCDPAAVVEVPPRDGFRSWVNAGTVVIWCFPAAAVVSIHA